MVGLISARIAETFAALVGGVIWCVDCGERFSSSQGIAMWRVVCVSAVAVLLAGPGAVRAAGPVEFSRDVRPLLSDRCYLCHGPDATTREAGLRLDSHKDALAELKSGGFAIVPGKLQESAIWERINSTDPDLKMPPADSGKSLSKAEIARIGGWIEQGAKWKGHWAWEPVARPEPPTTPWDDRAQNPIDRFVFAKLAEEKLKPAPPADKTTLLRRVTLDLTGLPPTPTEIDAFVNDDSPQAFETVVDRLLRSPRYGEHMGRYWLDAARYGDTHGLHLDNERSIWPYRDWVIEAYNRNQPFNEFTIEQLAGDLLPEPTVSQQVATGFNRCNVTTSEGGTIPEEFRVRYAIDRTETLATVWMGLTVGCAVCHDHKYDPISQREFYSLYAWYNSTADAAMDGNKLVPPPSVQVLTADQSEQVEKLQREIRLLEETITADAIQYEYRDPGPDADEVPEDLEEFVWIDDELPDGVEPGGNDGANSWKFVSGENVPVHSGKRSHTRTAVGLSQHFFTKADPGLLIGDSDSLFAYVYLDPKSPPAEVMLQFNDGTWEHRAYWGDDKIDWGTKNSPARRYKGPLPKTGKWARLEVTASEVGLKPGSTVNGWAFTQFDGTVHWDTAGIVTRTPQQASTYKSLAAWSAVQKQRAYNGLPEEIIKLLRTPSADRKPLAVQQLQAWFVQHVYTGTRAHFKTLTQKLRTLEEQVHHIRRQAPSSLVMRNEKNTRPTYVLTRGEYDKPDKQQRVEPGVPAVLPALREGVEPNRLTLAKWLVDGKHPLTARVIVNRDWQRYFGVGLVKTAEDFGSQGDWPSHPQLLDWLAGEFVASGWDVKHLQKLIVMSATYQQTARVSAELYQRDPENRLLARGPRFRLDAEMVRDTALAVSGLLVEKQGGKSVKPYQPAGLWEAVGYTSSNTARFKQDSGDALFRRSLYTFWKRTSPPPSLMTFDAPTREACTVRRPRTNTPLQALVLMNDVQYVEASRHLAERLMKGGGETDGQKIIYGYRLATGREPTAREISIVRTVLHAHRADFEDNDVSAVDLLSQGASPRDTSLDSVEHAAWTMIANLLLNLDETVTK